jgi:hypothetical protein
MKAQGLLYFGVLVLLFAATFRNTRSTSASRISRTIDKQFVRFKSSTDGIEQPLFWHGGIYIFPLTLNQNKPACIQYSQYDHTQ